MQLLVVVVVIVVAATNVIDKAPWIDLFRGPFFLGGRYMPLHACPNPTELLTASVETFAVKPQTLQR